MESKVCPRSHGQPPGARRRAIVSTSFWNFSPALQLFSMGGIFPRVTCWVFPSRDQRERLSRLALPLQRLMEQALDKTLVRQSAFVGNFLRCFEISDRHPNRDGFR